MSLSIRTLAPAPRRRSLLRAFTLGFAAVAVGVPLSGCGGNSTNAALDAPVVRPVAKTAPAARAAFKPGGVVAHVKRPAVLRARPGGRIVARLSPQTSFHSPTVLGVVRRQGDWYGVISSALANGHVGWIPAKAVDLYSDDFRIDVSLSKRQVVVHRGRSVALQFRVAVGGPSTPTPTGRFAITDKLLTQQPGSPYGCCILALSAHQPHTPQGWGGGDRVGMHATDRPDTIGQAVSLGCLRAPTDEMRRAVHLVPLGTLVTIRA